MKRFLLPWVVLALLIAAFAPPVLAQEETVVETTQEAKAADPRFPPSPEYAVTSDGLGVVVEGDVVIACDPTPPGEAGQLCAQRDSFPRSTIELEKDKAGTEKKDELPSTGGASMLALGVGALVVSGGLLARRILR